MDLTLSPGIAQNPFGQVLPAALAKAPNARATGNEKAMRETAQEFEAVFIGQMTEAMFAGLKSEEPFGGGHAEDMWRSQLSQEMGRSIAQSGGIGIADAVMRSMIAQQEAASRPMTVPGTSAATAANAYDNQDR